MSVSSKFDLGNAFVTSPFIPAKVLACIRLILAFYTLFTLFYSLAYEGAGSWFSYFTHLTYIGLCSWFWASGVQTATWAFREKDGQRKYLLRTWPRALQLAHEWLWSTVASFPVIVTVVYWVLLGASFDGPVKTWSTISMHALNTLFCLFEVVFTNNPAPRWIWLPVDIVVLALYLGLAYLSKSTIGYYVYDFLDPNEQGALLAAYIIGIGVAEVLLFSIMYGLIRLRQRLTRSQRAVEGATEADEDKSSSQQHEEKLGSFPA